MMFGVLTDIQKNYYFVQLSAWISNEKQTFQGFNAIAIVRWWIATFDSQINEITFIENYYDNAIDEKQCN